MFNCLIHIWLIYLSGSIFDSWWVIRLEWREIISLLRFTELLLVIHVAFQVIFQLSIYLGSLSLYRLWSYEWEVIILVNFPELYFCVFKFLLYFLNWFIRCIHFVKQNFLAYFSFLLINVFKVLQLVQELFFLLLPW